MYKKIGIIAMAAGLALSTSACTQTEQRTAGYGASGAALGALAGGALSGTGGGALTGAAIGAATGTVFGSSIAMNDRRSYRHREAICTYRDTRNNIYQAPCHR